MPRPLEMMARPPTWVKIGVMCTTVGTAVAGALLTKIGDKINEFVVEAGGKRLMDLLRELNILEVAIVVLSLTSIALLMVLFRTRQSGLFYVKNEGRERWDKLRQIRYAYVQYSPLMQSDISGPYGFGVDLLEKLVAGGIFNDGSEPAAAACKEARVEVKASGERRWNDVFDGLRRGDYDVVATPLFATYERTRAAAFTMPFFFSEIGLFVDKRTADEFNLRNLSIDDLRTRLAVIGSIEFVAIKGEISETLAQRYRGKRPIVQSDQDNVHELFAEVAEPSANRNGTDPSARKSYVLFSETFFSRFEKLVRAGSVVNVLRPHEILYPVCFAVRHGDCRLLNLLNIRLLQLANQNGALKQLEDSLRRQDRIATDDGRESKVAWPRIQPEEIGSSFVMTWPTPELDREQVRRPGLVSA